MRFKVGDEVFELFCGLTPCKIVRVFPKTNRYEVQEKTNSGYDGWKHYVKEDKVFGSREEYLRKKLARLNKDIKELNEEKISVEEELSPKNKEVSHE